MNLTKTLAVIALLALTACAGQKPETQMNFAPESRVETASAGHKDLAIALAREMRAAGKRVWCVPFARNYSGLNLRGNAHTWWNGAKGLYERGHEPKIGAVMTFSSSRAMPKGHVAVVSKVVSDREILIDHANWTRNKVSLGQKVIDVSKNGDWSAVKVVSNGRTGRVNPVSGFIYNTPAKG